MNARRLFFPVVMLILAYEWIVSGLDKLISPSFVADFHQTMLSSLPQMQYHFYARLMRQFCLAHCVLVASIVEVGELLVGVAFVLLAVMVFLSKDARVWSVLGVITGVVSAFFTLNFYFYQGGAFFVNTSHPFDEGIPIDLIMVLLQLSIAGVFFAQLKTSSRAALKLAEVHPFIHSKHRSRRVD